MLVLTRKFQQQIKIGDQITITILRVKGQTVRVGIDAPRDVRVVRAELPPVGELAGSGEAAAQVSVVLADDQDETESSEDSVVPAAKVETTAAPLAVLASRLASRKGERKQAPLRVALAAASESLAK